MSSDLIWKGYSISDPKKYTDFKLTDFKPKTWAEDDIDIAIDYCGVCGSDVHTITGGWGDIITPLVTGHEVIGHAVKVGKNVKSIKVGDRVGVGAQTWSCGECPRCKSGDENYCPKQVDTYNAKYPDGSISHGGYSTAIRCQERFVMPIPDALPSNAAAPLLCAGLTVFAPLTRHGAKPGAKVGVVGIGGLGHLAVQFAKALGCAEVVAISSSDSKKEDALKMGATQYLVSSNKEELAEKYADFFDLIICTADVSDAIPLDLLPTLKINGRFIICAMPDDKLPSFKSQDMAGNGCLIGGSHIGNKKESLQMLKLAAEHNISAWIEEYPMSKAAEGVERCKSNAVRYRAVLKQDIHPWNKA